MADLCLMTNGLELKDGSVSLAVFIAHQFNHLLRIHAGLEHGERSPCFLSKIC
jgi:hypothetical protein